MKQGKRRASDEFPLCADVWILDAADDRVTLRTGFWIEQVFALYQCQISLDEGIGGVEQPSRQLRRVVE